ncbi:Antitoxin igA-2 [Photorhabdus australis subsp. thailandensis]|uniref:Antitoxin igA-2 n=1 Tax=Photorhabdus australis subsp. thailandensis TaxID=2805096 RepID=A0A1C0U6L2_9GAMM|nr:Antitoxin igA-2 [Photorhabdus australis subsp. thailandensis]
MQCNKSKTSKAATNEVSNVSNYQGTNMNNVTNKNLPVIAGVEITTDSEGRFNLNALHKASGLGSNKAPAQWLRTKQAQELVLEIEKETMQICTVSLDGRNGGTFAHELLAVEYAGWISPKFRLQVNQTFIDYRSGKLAPVSVDPMQVLNDPAAMRGLLLTYTEKVLTLESQVEAVKVKNIRHATGLTQTGFAKLISVNVGTLRNWEQGRREPTGPAKALLKAIEKDPVHVLKALSM